MTRPLIYLACPYSDPDPAVREQRFRMVNAAAAQLILQGHVIFSPVSMSHPIDLLIRAHKLETEFWISYDQTFMDHCDQMFVLCIDGWSSSVGVNREIEYFKRRGKPIKYLSKKLVEGERADPVL